MPDLMTVNGFIATVPRHITTNEGLSILSFRLASPQRRYDRKADKWVETEANFYTITSFRQLATNASASLNKGDRVVVTGRLKVREWTTEEKSGLNVDIEADAIGHDLSWGTTSFARTIVSTSIPSSPGQNEDDAPTQGDAPTQHAEAELTAPAEAWAVAEQPAAVELADATVPF